MIVLSRKFLTRASVFQSTPVLSAMLLVSILAQALSLPIGLAWRNSAGSDPGSTGSCCRMLLSGGCCCGVTTGDCCCTRLKPGTAARAGKQTRGERSPAFVSGSCDRPAGSLSLTGADPAVLNPAQVQPVIQTARLPLSSSRVVRLAAEPPVPPPPELSA